MRSIGTISLLTAHGSTVGDNLIHDLLVNYICSLGENPVRGFKTESKLTIFGGGGLIWEHTYPPLLEEAREAVRSGRPVLGLGLGVQGINDRAKWSFLRGFHTLTVRDPLSQEQLRTLLEIDSTLTQDLAWLYDVPVGTSQTGVLGVIFPNITYYPLVVTQLKRIKSMRIRYITFEPPAIPYYRQALPKTKGEMCSFEPLEGWEQRSGKMVEALSQCEAIYSGHLHGVIFSIMAQVPCLVAPLTQKITSMCDWVGYSRFYALAQDEISIILRNVLERQGEIKALQREIASRERLKAEENLKIIRSMVHG